MLNKWQLFVQQGLSAGNQELSAPFLGSSMLSSDIQKPVIKIQSSTGNKTALIQEKAIHLDFWIRPLRRGHILYF